MTAPFVSHGQNWEDVRLRRIFDTQVDGRYIDVGAAHPTIHSFTRYLYDKGWTGINLEPMPAFFEALVTERTRDVNLNAAVSDQVAEATFYVNDELPGSSSLLAPSSARSVAITVPTTTLAQVCAAHAGDVDVLKVDVEGAEAAVLRGADWTTFRPRLVVVERNDPASWEDHLLGRGYLHAVDDGVNSWYVSEEEAAWVPVLGSPVSVLDRFVPREWLRGETTARVCSAQSHQLQQMARGVRLGLASQPPAAAAVVHERPRQLIALSSANQLYSGTGRALFETLGRMADDLAVTLTIDNVDARNVGILKHFAAVHDLPLVVGVGQTVSWAPDHVNLDLARSLDQGNWDVVECVSWANAATNGVVLEHAEDSTIVYTPHLQPLNTVPMSTTASAVVDATNRRMLDRADLVLCDTRHEQAKIQAMRTDGQGRVIVLGLGADFDRLTAGAVKRPRRLLFVGDFRESRKRLDRVFAGLDHLGAAGRDIELAVLGNQSGRVFDVAPAHLRSRLRSLGYVTEDGLLAAYHDAAALVLLSEYEAFGLPILEAIATATPAIVSDLAPLRSAFDGVPGVVFVDPDSPEEVGAAMLGLVDDGNQLRAELQAGRDELAARFDWSRTATRKRNHVLATAGRRYRGARPT